MKSSLKRSRMPWLPRRVERPNWTLSRRCPWADSRPVLVMIRPHPRSFAFSNAEVAVMCGDILAARRLGADAFLTGCLTEDRRVDVEGVEALQEAASTLPLHFHLAWEMTTDPAKALETLIELGVQSVRISGGGIEGRAVDGMAAIKRYARLAKGRIELFLAGGVSLESIPQLVRGSGVPNVHVGRAARTPRTQYGSVGENAVRDLAAALDRAAAALRNER